MVVEATRSSLEALEVVSNTSPVDLRREEIAIRQLGKINSYKNTIPNKRKLEVWKETRPYCHTFGSELLLGFLQYLLSL
jgi:hypothetical protein